MEIKVLKWKVSLKGIDKEIFVTDEEKRVLESMFCDYKKSRKDDILKLGMLTCSVSDIRYFEPVQYMNANKKPAYEYWYCNWCNVKNKWHVDRCECEERELFEGIGKQEKEYNEWKVKYFEKFPLYFWEWLRKTTEKKLKTFIS